MGGCLSHHEAWYTILETIVPPLFCTILVLLFKLIVYLDFVHDTFLPKHLKLYKPTSLSRLGTGCKSFDQKKKKNMKMDFVYNTFLLFCYISLSPTPDLADRGMYPPA